MLKYIKKFDNTVAKTIKINYVKYSLILLLLLFTIKIKSISTNTLSMINKDIILVGLGLLVVYLVYVDIVIALVLTLCIITLIQEYNTRQTVLHMNNSNNLNKKASIDVETEVIISSEDENIQHTQSASKNITNIANQMASMTYKEQPTTAEFKKQMRTVAPSSYGNMTETELLVPTDLKYENQIGNLYIGDKRSITNEMHSDADDKFQNFQMFAKVNMGQSVCSNPVGEPFYNLDKTIEEKQYDHPSSKTITEMLRVQGVDYINEKNLEMIQSNNAKLGPVPCAIESICGSMNVQSF